MPCLVLPCLALPCLAHFPPLWVTQLGGGAGLVVMSWDVDVIGEDEMPSDLQYILYSHRTVRSTGTGLCWLAGPCQKTKKRQKQKKRQHGDNVLYKYDVRLYCRYHSLPLEELFKSEFGVFMYLFTDVLPVSSRYCIPYRPYLLCACTMEGCVLDCR